MTSLTSPAGEHVASSASQYATFYVGGLFFGIDVLRVQEVLRHHELTQVPIAPDVIEGLMNLRGQIVMALDMRRRLGIEPRRPVDSPINVVIRSEEGAVSLLVDEIGDVIEAPEESFENVPDTIRGETRELILGVHKLPGKLLLILNTDRVLQIETRQAELASNSYEQKL